MNEAVEEFLRRLAATKGEWELRGKSRMLRTKERDHCPLTRVGGGACWRDWLAAAAHLGIDSDAVLIATAADRRGVDAYDGAADAARLNVMRARLMEACGVEDESA